MADDDEPEPTIDGKHHLRPNAEPFTSAGTDPNE